MRPLCGRLSQQTNVSGPAAARLRAASPGDEDADRRFGRVGMREIVRDVRMRFVQRAGCRIVAVALLGDRRRHDGDRADPRSGAISCGARRSREDRFAQAPMTRARRSVAVRVSSVYRPSCAGKGLDGARRLERDAADAPARRRRRECRRCRPPGARDGTRRGRGAGCRPARSPDRTPAARRCSAAARASTATGATATTVAQACCGCSFTRDTSCVGLTKRSAISSHTSVTTM